MPASSSPRRSSRRTSQASAEEAGTRERMLDVALEAFAELGFDGASTRVIATRAGVNQGLIPYYFGTKEKLWREAVDRAFAELGDAIAAAEPSPGARSVDERAAAAELMRQLVRFVARRPAFVRMMTDEGKREGPRMRWIVDRHARPLFESALERVGPGISQALVASELGPMHSIYIVIGAATHLFHQAPECKRLAGIDAADPTVVEAHADALIALFLGPETPNTKKRKKR